MTDVQDVSTERADELLAEVARLRGRVRRSPGTPWFPLVYFGVLTAVSAGLTSVYAGAGQLPLWLGAGLLGWWLTGRHYGRLAQRQGSTRRDHRTELIAVALFCACLVVAILADDARTSLEGVIVVVAIAYGVIGWRVRSPATAAAVLAVSAVALGLAAGGLAPWAFELVFGVGLALTGLGLRSRARRSP